MKNTHRTPGYRYRLCSKCGLEWNVARNQNDKKYIYPHCYFADKKKENKNNGKDKEFF